MFWRQPRCLVVWSVRQGLSHLWARLPPMPIPGRPHHVRPCSGHFHKKQTEWSLLPVQGPIQSTATSQSTTRPPSSSIPFTRPFSVRPPTTLAKMTSASDASIKAVVRSLGWTLKQDGRSWQCGISPHAWAVSSGVPRTSGLERAPSTHFGAPLSLFPLWYGQ